MNQQNVFKHQIHTIWMVRFRRFYLKVYRHENVQRIEWKRNVTFALSFHFHFNGEMCFSVNHLISQISSLRRILPFFKWFDLFCCHLIGTSLGLVQALIPSMILRFTMGFVCMSMVNISFVLAVEMVTGKWSTIIGILDLLPIPLSYMLIAGIAYVTRNWRDLQLIVSSPWFGLLLFW